MTDLFFVYCPESGFDCFLTLDAALDEANERIQGYLDDAWSEEVTGVCAGKITHRAQMCDQVFPDGEIDEDGFDERGDYWGSDCEYKCGYKMLPAGKNPAPDVRGEPATFCEDAALTIAERTFSAAVGEQLASDIIQFAQRLHSLYTAPKPAEQQLSPEVSGLVEALEEMIDVAHAIDGWECFPCGPIDRAQDALTAYRKQGGEK